MKISKLLLAACTMLFAGSLAAQSIDLGRGELPVTVPEGYDDGTPAPLLVLLHGYTSSGANQDSYMGFSELADSYGFLFVAPDGTRESGGDQNRFWNASDACCNFYESEVDDAGYIASIIEAMKSEYNVDENRVYLVGHSNGGFMSFHMAYEHSDTIAAIVSLAGANHMEMRDAPPNGVHILQIHGTADSVIIYGGGDIQDTRYPGALNSVRRWASYNGCSMEGAGRELRDLDASLPGHESGTYLFEAGCKSGGSAELWTIPAGAHSPILSDTFAEQVVEWLLAHPKTRGESG
ncbi:MAG: alpha/beta fold hydrolase [Gammaproteobacteria bacterium]|nr:alpha/beta fold hydrolase [Gammaproteobacteria bacterium]MYC60544.1 alpha/beta fold hydrolase [Gammaproteobacteria bacterium]MYH85583.1 alpha/beta fold hydrolase [Gammaproteobacteria bacterium]MYK05131.1 alpha/beta fold hydrolase [Gammaproteobacteria bacterium]